MRQAAFIRVIADEHVAVADIFAVKLQNFPDQMAVDRRVKKHRRRHNSPPRQSRITQEKSRDSRMIVE